MINRIFMCLSQPISLILAWLTVAAKVITKKVGSLARFRSAHAAKETLVLMQKMFQMRQCTNTFFKQRQRPCLEYQIKRCRAPCVGLVSPEEYAEDVNNTIRFLKGDSSDIHSTLN